MEVDVGVKELVLVGLGVEVKELVEVDVEVKVLVEVGLLVLVGVLVKVRVLVGVKVAVAVAAAITIAELFRGRPENWTGPETFAPASEALPARLAW